MGSIKQNFLFNTLLSLSQVFFPLITFPYVARVILPAGIGEVTFIESICRYLMLLCALGIPIYGVREIAKVKNEKNKLNKLFTELIVIHVIITLLVLLFYVLAIYYIPILYNDRHFYLVGILLILSNVFLVEWYFQGIGDFKFITIRNLILKSVLTTIVFFVVKDKYDVLKYFTLIVLLSVFNSIINFWYSMKTITLDFSIKMIDLKKHLVPLFYIFSSIAFISIYTFLDTIMLGLMTNETTVGLYTTGLKLSRIPMLIVGALGVVLIPKLAEHYHNDRLEEFMSLINKSIKFVFTFSIPTIFMLIGLSDIIIMSFAGPEFIKASSVLKILSSLSMLIGLSNIFGLQILTPMGKDKFLSLSVLYGMLISFCFNLVFIPLLKENGAALSNLLAEIAVTVSTMFFAKRYIKYIVDVKFILKTVISALPLMFIPLVVMRFVDKDLSVMLISIMLSVVYFSFVHLCILKNELFMELKKTIEKS